MTAEYVMGLAQQTMATAFWTILPILGFGMSMGIIIAVLQAATQIQETSLTFVPKLVGMGIALTLFGPWILERLTGFTVTLINSAAGVGG